ncbi:MAG: hypothetical protein AAF515_18135 [Pseudomonadota bacterium]
MSDTPKTPNTDALDAQLDTELDDLLAELAEHRATPGLATRIAAALPAEPTPWWQEPPWRHLLSPWKSAVAALLPLALGIALGASIPATGDDDSWNDSLLGLAVIDETSSGDLGLFEEVTP